MKVCNPVKPDKCSHIFCRRCFEVYIQKFSVCPTCKQEFTSYSDIFRPSISSYEKIRSYNDEIEDNLYRLSFEEYPKRKCVICKKDNDKEYLIRCERCFINESHYYCDISGGLMFGKYICPICRNRFFNHINRKSFK